MLDIISAYCSILGFVVSIFTFGYAFFIEKRVREFEKKVLFNLRVPILTDDLKQQHSQLYKDINAKNERRTRGTISLCITIIEDINTKLPGELGKKGIKLKRDLKKQYRSNFQLENKKTTKWRFWIRVSTIKNLYESYDKLNSFITKIDILKKDNEITK